MWTANAICCNSLGLFRDYGLNHIFLGIKLFCFLRQKAETFSICLKSKFVKRHKISTPSAHSDIFYFHQLSGCPRIMGLLVLGKSHIKRGLELPLCYRLGFFEQVSVLFLNIQQQNFAWRPTVFLSCQSEKNFHNSTSGIYSNLHLA